MDKEISNMLRNGSIIAIDNPVWISPIFAISKKRRDDKWRVIINMSDLNQFIETPHFKCETGPCVTDNIVGKSYSCSIHLTSAYHIIAIMPKYIPYTVFQWKAKTYGFSELPFECSISPSIFYRCTYKIYRFLRSRNIKLNRFYNDYLLINENSNQPLEEVGLTIRTFTSLLFPRVEKVSFTLKTYLPDDKIREIVSQATTLHERKRVLLTSLASLLGKINFAEHASIIYTIKARPL
uniref:Reverse transcriptase domain-containing protein n=1 Tax=Strongyloides venezuelensis TaxID=75913 RepID=A0A0K0EY17_STRVS